MDYNNAKEALRNIDEQLALAIGRVLSCAEPDATRLCEALITAEGLCDFLRLLRYNVENEANKNG